MVDELLAFDDEPVRLAAALGATLAFGRAVVFFFAAGFERAVPADFLADPAFFLAVA